MRGEWRSEATWPPERLDGARAAARGRRAPTRSTSAATSAGPPGSRAPAGSRGGCPDDQRFDDALSLTYDWEPLDGRSRRDGPPARAAHRHLARARRLPLGAALRRLPRRHLGPRRPRAAQPHAPQRPRRAGRARAGRADARSRSSSRRPRGSSSRATGCGSRSRAPTGRTSGRRRAARRSRSSAASVELVLPVLDGPPPLPAPGLPPTTGKDTHAPATRTTSSRRSSGGSRRTSSSTRPAPSRATARLRGAVRSPRRGAVRGHGRRLEGRPGARLGARARPSTASPGPRRTCAPRRRSTCARTPTAYHVVVELVAEELGPEPGDATVLPRAALRAHVPRRLA